MLRSTLPRVALLSLSLALLAPFAIELPLAAQGKKGEWTENNAGAVPTRFGDLVTVAGATGNYTLVFRNSGGDIRIVELGGAKLPSEALVIRRNEPEKKEKPDPQAKWRDKEAGVIPESFGELVSFTGNKAAGGYTLIFRGGEGEIRVVDFQGTQVKKVAKRIDRVETASPSKAPDGWKEESSGRIPENFGTLIEVIGAPPNISLVFQDPDGEVRIVDMQGTQVPKKATKITREYE